MMMKENNLDEIVKDIVFVKAQPLNSAREVAFPFPVT